MAKFGSVQPTIIVLGLAGILSVLGGCSTGQLQIESSPRKARVTVRKLGESESRDLGQTPILIDAKELAERYKLTGPFFVEVALEGYQTEKITVTQVEGASVNLSLSLKEEIGLQQTEKLNKVIEALFESQSMARTGRFADAHSRLRAVAEAAPDVSVIPELEGDIYFLEKKYQEAYSAYGSALKLKPGSPHVQKMRAMIERYINDESARVPATQGRTGRAAQ